MKSEENSLNRWILRENTFISRKSLKHQLGVSPHSWLQGYTAVQVSKARMGHPIGMARGWSLNSDKHRWAYLRPLGNSILGEQVNSCLKQLLAFPGPPTQSRGGLHLQQLRDWPLRITVSRARDAHLISEIMRPEFTHMLVIKFLC